MTYKHYNFLSKEVEMNSKPVYMLVPITKVCDAEVLGTELKGLPSRACIYYNLSVMVTKTYLEFELYIMEFEILLYST